MRRFLARRVVEGAVVVFVVATLSFLLVRLAPGDPFSAALEDPRVDPATRAYWRAAYGLDRPLPEQYVRFLAGAVRGDLGPSIAYGRPAADVLREALPHTLLLTGTALLLSIALGIAFGSWLGAQRARPAARIADGASLVVSSIPEFWLAIILLLVFAYRFGVLPSGGTVTLGMYEYLSPLERLADRARHLVLPVTTLTLLATATIARYQRAALLEVLPDEFVRTARAKGLDERRVVYRHALRNALLPVITVVGLALPALVGGAVFVEYVFSWPGMGRVAVESFRARDYAVVVGATTLGALLVVAGGIIAELLHAVADPRVRGR